MEETTIKSGTLDHTKVVPPVEARQGVVSGRVLTVLVVSVLVLGAIYAIIWLANAHL